MNSPYLWARNDLTNRYALARSVAFALVDSAGSAPPPRLTEPSLGSLSSVLPAGLVIATANARGKSFEAGLAGSTVRSAAATVTLLVHAILSVNFLRPVPCWPSITSMVHSPTSESGPRASSVKDVPPWATPAIVQVGVWLVTVGG